jgi:hypothetical protein
VVVALVVVAEVLHGRLPHDGREYLAGAVDQAVAGVAGGFTPRARAEARRLVERAGDVRGAAETRALVEAIAEDASELPNPIHAVGARVVALTHRLVRARWVPTVTVAVLVASLAGSVGTGLSAWWRGADQPGWIVVGLIVSALGATALAGWGLWVVRYDHRGGYLRFRWAVLASLLVVQVFVFRLREWSAVWGLLVELVVAGVVAAELQQTERAEPALPALPERGSARRGGTGGGTAMRTGDGGRDGSGGRHPGADIR